MLAEGSPRTTALALLLVVLLLPAACRTTHATPSGGASGAMQIAAAPTPLRPAAITDQLVQQGDSIFNNASCKKCHGLNGTGGANGPNLSVGKWQHSDGSFDGIIGVITTGVPAAEIKDPSHRFDMHPRGGTNPPMTDDQVKALAAYVWTIGHQ